MTPTPSSSRSARSEQERTGISPKRPGLAGKGAGVSTGNDHPPTQASETRADPPERCEACPKFVFVDINGVRQEIIVPALVHHAENAQLRSELAEVTRIVQDALSRPEPPESFNSMGELQEWFKPEEEIFERAKAFLARTKEERP